MYVYKTTNLLNGKIYIGQTSQNNPRYFGSGILIKNALKKYGRKNFKNEILEYCETRKQLNEREIFWIDFYNSNNLHIGYNLDKGGEQCEDDKFYKTLSEKIKLSHANVSGDKNPMYGQTHSEEAREKIRKFRTGKKTPINIRKKLSEQRKGRKNSNYNPKPILQILNNEVIKEWQDLYSLKEMGYNSKLISRVCRNQRKSAFGYTWKFKE